MGGHLSGSVSRTMVKGLYNNKGTLYSGGVKIFGVEGRAGAALGREEEYIIVNWLVSMAPLTYFSWAFVRFSSSLQYFGLLEIGQHRCLPFAICTFAWSSLMTSMKTKMFGWVGNNIYVSYGSYRTSFPRGVARVFGARGGRLPFWRPSPPAPPFPPPPPPPTPYKLCNSPKFAKSRNYWQNLAIWKQIKFLVGRFLVGGGGGHLDPAFLYFWKIVSVFCQWGAAKTSINNDFFEKLTKIII